MKALRKFKKMKYIYFILWISFGHTPLFGSNISQFTAGRPLYLIDICNNTASGYSQFVINYLRMPAMLALAISSAANSIQVCASETAVYEYGYGASGWIYVSGSATTNCYTSTYYCLYKNDNY